MPEMLPAISRAETVRTKLQEALLDVRRLETDFASYRDQYEAVYLDLGKLGEALGHPNCARPESASVLMRRWTDEVRALVQRYEPERLTEMERQWQLR
jgi:hypothetical protein